MIKVAVIGIVCVVIAVFFRKSHPEYAVYIGVAGCLLIFFLGASKLEGIIATINKIQSYLTINETYIKILLKMIGIAFIAEFAADICKDAGDSAIAGQIQLVGKLTILSISMPIIMSLLETIQNFF